MTVREMIECLKTMPPDMTVATHPAGLATWLECWPPVVRMIGKNGVTTISKELAVSKYVTL
jgi:hypothetical protein